TMSDLSSPISDWPQFLTVALLVMIRVSSLMVFAPVFSSSAIAPRIKAGFVFSVTVLLAPAVATVPDARPSLDFLAVLGELGVGLVFGLSLMMLNEALLFAGTMLGMQFSFSLVNLLDPNSKIETPVLGQLLGWLGTLVLIGAGLDRTMLAALVRSFRTVPVGHAFVQARTGAGLAGMAGGIFLAGLQLAAPVVAAGMVVEITIALIGRMAPQLPAMVVGIPLKTLICFGVLVASLALWPGWIEGHFTALLDAAGRLMANA
ncbi:MAG TPA: flagellar biosynthetic protein FliR, partial [Edaphobacter sp.]|nr:flagellar biosynthetic protein FliR [Edaphobacter sp.]